MTTPTRRTLFRAEGKHEDGFWDIEASGGFDAVCLAVFQKRDALGYYPLSAPVTPTPPSPLPPTVTDPAVIAFQQKREADHEEALRLHKRAHQEWAVFSRARAGEKNAASWIIRARKHHEYEGYSTYELQVVPAAP